MIHNTEPLTNPKPIKKLSRLLRATLELTLLALGVFLVTLWIIVDKAEAHLQGAAEKLLPAALGSELLPGDGQARAPFGGLLYLNGLPLQIETRNLPGGPSEQASTIQKQCRGFSFEGKATAGLGRTVLCLHAPNGKDAELTAGIQRFLETADFAELGSPEVSFLRSAERGDEPMTQLLRVRARSLDLASAFPTEGDAPGLDPSFAPRPSGRRILSVQFQEALGPAERAPLRVREILFAYQSASSPSETLKEYETALLSDGRFRMLPTGTTGEQGRAFESDKDMFLVLTGPEGTGSWLSLALLPKTGSAK